MGVEADAADRPASPLLNEIEALTRDLEWTLEHFTFVANVTTLGAECDIAYSPAMSVASCLSMARPALAFVGDSAELLENYATFLVESGSEVYLLASDAQRAVVEAAFDVQAIQPQWQMVFRGAAADLPQGTAEPLTDEDWPAMQALARAEKKEIQLLGKSPCEHGPAFGVWEKKKLAALGLTTMRVAGAVQIGNLLARQGDDAQPYSDWVIAALVRAHVEEQICVFTIVPQDATPEVRRLERLGFERRRPFYLMHCIVKQEADAVDEDAGL